MSDDSDLQAMRTGTAAYWDGAADAFDDEPDHGLRDPEVRAAWAGRLADWLPDEPSDVLDLGCGTGSLSLLAAERGHRVMAVDFSPAMAARARHKLAGTSARVLVGDAAQPPVKDGRFDAVLARHVLWMMDDPVAVLHRWAGLLRPGGRLVLIEGLWGRTEPVGIRSTELTALVGRLGARFSTELLSGDPVLWGRRVDDERYAMVVHPAAAHADRTVADTHAPSDSHSPSDSNAPSDSASPDSASPDSAGTQDAPSAPAAAAEPIRPHRHREVVDVHLILRRGGEVLLGRRANTGYADGLLHAPSGHAEDGEDVVQAMIREAREETGLDLEPGDLRVALVMQHRAPADSAQPRMGWFFEARYGAGGEPVNREPDKCSQLDWFPLDALPDDMVAYCRAGLDAYRAGDRFVLHWHRPGDSIAYDPRLPDRATPLRATEPPQATEPPEAGASLRTTAPPRDTPRIPATER
ncbi:methyltransferase domain-containing protein [Streptomyces sp. NPDC047108]|uniref:methyltransferase domain-containing protein n=1 Tax=Streptomyces sp. NPDC047108 TaxID=3155025 RepID=UPI003410C43B